MQHKDHKPKTGTSRGTLFPDLAPYGTAKPLPEPMTKVNDIDVETPVFQTQPTISELPLSALFDPAPAPMPESEPPTEVVAEPQTSHVQRRPFLIAGVAAVLLTSTLLGGWFYTHRPVAKPANPVPAAVASVVKFPVYFPEQTKLPTGYILNQDSFRSPIENGIGYTVSYGTGQTIVFSVQAAPTSSDAQAFNDSYIPKHEIYKVPLGEAVIGTYKAQTMVSLPIPNEAWVVITAPPDIDQNQLRTIIASLRR